MASIPVFTVTPSAAAQAYSTTAGGGAAGATGGTDFGAMVEQAIGNVVQTGQQAESQSLQAIAGNGNITDVVTAVAKAELALQTTTTIRDRVVQAYQDIMKMPI